MNAGPNGTVVIVTDDAAHIEKARAALRPRPVLERDLECTGAGASQACSAPAVILLIFGDLSTHGVVAGAAALRLQWPGVPTLHVRFTLMLERGLG